MQRPHLDGERLLALVVGNAQAVLLHLVDMHRPHIDEGHVLARAYHVGSGIAPYRAHPDHRDPLAHNSSPHIPSGPRGQAQTDPSAPSETARAGSCLSKSLVLY